MDMLNSLLKDNASSDTLTYVFALNMYLSQTSHELYYYTGDERYYSWWVISMNIRNFFIDVFNDSPDSKVARLLEKAELIAEISNY